MPKSKYVVKAYVGFSDCDLPKNQSEVTLAAFGCADDAKEFIEGLPGYDDDGPDLLATMGYDESQLIAGIEEGRYLTGAVLA